MSKQGQHQGDSDDKDKSKGPNNPSKSVEITTGSYKKKETYQQQAASNKADDKAAQHGRREWQEDTRVEPTTEGSTRARNSDLDSNRNGSESNA